MMKSLLILPKFRYVGEFKDGVKNGEGVLYDSNK